MNELTQPNRQSAVPVKQVPRKSARLVWAITIGEAILLGGAAFALLKYWLMLPVPVRNGGAVLLGALTVFGIYRLIRFYRRSARQRQATDAVKTGLDEPASAPAVRPDMQFPGQVNVTIPPGKKKPGNTTVMLASESP